MQSKTPSIFRNEWVPRVSLLPVRMRVNRATGTNRNRVSLFLFAPIVFVAFIATVGCAHVNNPWVDSSTVVLDDLTTASAENYRGKREFDSNTWRTNWPVSYAVYENGAVTHWPTWFQDPFEDKGNRDYQVEHEDAPDEEFRMNWVDYMHIAYGPARFVLNGALWPVSAVVTPPGRLLESDGKLSPSIIDRYDHDPARSDSATREPPFINDVDKLSELATSSDK